jgi:hypothetical protein
MGRYRNSNTTVPSIVLELHRITVKLHQMAANMPFRKEAPQIFCRQWRGAIFDKGNCGGGARRPLAQDATCS